MLKNILYLIDTSQLSLMVTLFTMTMNKHGQVVLRFVKNLGRLYDIENFDTKDAYIAVKEVEYQSYNSDFVKSVMPEKLKSIAVSSVVNNDEDSSNFKPFGIKIFKNNVQLVKQDTNPVVSTSLIMAALNYADVRAQNGGITILTGDKENCTFFEFKSTNDSMNFKVSEIPIERNIHLYDAPLVSRNVRVSKLGDSFVSYNVRAFNEDWTRKTLFSMCDFFVDGTEKLIPTIHGSWNEKYIKGMSFPYLKFFKEIPSKKIWEEFLKDKNNFPVSMEEELKQVS